jgi:hypothetical protein
MGLSSVCTTETINRRIFTSTIKATTRKSTLRTSKSWRAICRAAPLVPVLDWGELHRRELRVNWALAQQRKPLNDISPLE